jgi:hypothetical protein
VFPACVVPVGAEHHAFSSKIRCVLVAPLLSPEGIRRRRQAKLLDGRVGVLFTFRHDQLFGFQDGAESIWDEPYAFDGVDPAALAIRLPGSKLLGRISDDLEEQFAFFVPIVILRDRFAGLRVAGSWTPILVQIAYFKPDCSNYILGLAPGLAVQESFPVILGDRKTGTRRAGIGLARLPAFP